MTNKNQSNNSESTLLNKLGEFGLSKSESKIYLNLLEEGVPVGGSQLAASTGIHRQYVYLTLEKLIELGLVVKIEKKSRAAYKAAPPATIEKIARKKLWKASDLAEELSKVSSLDHEQDFEVIVGEKGIRNYQLEFVEKANIGETQYILGGSAAQFIEIMGEFYNKMIVDQEKKKFVTFYIGRKSEHTSLNSYRDSGINFNVRFLSDIPDKLPQFTIRRNTVELYSFFNPPILYIIKSGEAASKFKEFFQILWKITNPAK